MTGPHFVERPRFTEQVDLDVRQFEARTEFRVIRDGRTIGSVSYPVVGVLRDFVVSVAGDFDVALTGDFTVRPNVDGCVDHLTYPGLRNPNH